MVQFGLFAELQIFHKHLLMQILACRLVLILTSFMYTHDE